MEPFEQDELTEGELDRLLEGWTASEAPARLRAAIFPESSASWWKRLWISIDPHPSASSVRIAARDRSRRVARRPAARAPNRSEDRARGSPRSSGTHRDESGYEVCLPARTIEL